MCRVKNSVTKDEIAIMSNFLFFDNAYKCRLRQMRQNVSAGRKGLNYMTLYYIQTMMSDDSAADDI